MERYAVKTTPAFEREARKLTRKSPSIANMLERLCHVLERDPLNLSRQYNIKKLTNVKPGDGQWRIRVADYRLRYDVFPGTVVLHSVRHRREAY